jgi:SAM-dependent methyltransferase
VGCGGGWLFRILKGTKKVVRYVGVDASEVVIREFEKRERRPTKNIERKLILSTLNGLPPLTEGTQFDVIVIKEVLQHLQTDDAIRMIQYIMKHFQFKYFIIINKYKLNHVKNRSENHQTTRTLSNNKYRMAPIDFNRHVEFKNLGFTVINVSKNPAWQMAYLARP